MATITIQIPGGGILIDEETGADFQVPGVGVFATSEAAPIVTVPENTAFQVPGFGFLVNPGDETEFQIPGWGFFASEFVEPIEPPAGSPIEPEPEEELPTRPDKVAVVCPTINLIPDVCENEYDDEGNLINGTGTDSDNNSCDTVGPDDCPTTDAGNTCKPWQLTKNRDNCIINDYVDEALLIGGADVNVFKLLGIHEQGKLQDLTENGNAISSGDMVGFPKEDAFTTFVDEWRSAQVGQANVTSGFIGYDFGEIKLENDRVRYSVETAVKHNVASIKIKQADQAKNRATKVRIERSSDGKKWFGAAVITLPNDDCLNTIYFRNTVPMRFWRLRALEFGGGASDYWAVQALEFFDFDLTSIDDIQDKIWNENRDRDYSDQSLLIKAFYDLTDIQTDLSRFGIELPSQTLSFSVNFRSVASILGRPIVIGDIFEVPSEIQFDVKMNEIKKYMEVTDVAWSTEGYTPGWQPLMQRVTAQPMLASQETADIVGGLEGYDNDNGFFENFDQTEGMDTGNSTVFQDQSDISQSIDETSTDPDHLPQRGRDPADIEQFSEAQKIVAEEQQTGGARALENIGLNPRQLYVEDGLPPNGLSFTEGDDFPPSPSNGNYHRLTYSSISTKIPARLFRFSSAKNRWIFMEKDKRSTFGKTKPILQEFLCSADRIPAEDIAK